MSSGAIQSLFLNTTTTGSFVTSQDGFLMGRVCVWNGSQAQIKVDGVQVVTALSNSGYFTGQVALPCIPVKAGTEVYINLVVGTGASNTFAECILYGIKQ